MSGVLLVVLLVTVAAGCGQAAGQDTETVVGAPALDRSAGTTPTTTAPDPTTTSVDPPEVEPESTATTEVPALDAAQAPPPPPPTPPRTVHEQAWTPFASVEGVVLLHPSARVELIGFHESNHDGARHLDVLPTAAAPVVLETRNRGTGERSAADVVVDPEVEVRAPVTGRVLRAGTYVLYCDYRDDFAVIEPDARPGWEVKVLHIDGVMVRAGERVEAGVTVLAPRPTPLPFESQVDELTAEPSWPHVHIEVVDPSIPNTPKGGRRC